MKTTAYTNASRETFLLVRVNDDTNDYINMSRGIVDIVTLDKDMASADLKPAPKANQNLLKNATTIQKSVLPKTPLATLVLNQILTNAEQDDFVTPAEAQLASPKAKAKATQKAKKVSPRNMEGNFTLADLARELKLDPRDVRAKFRKLKMEKPEGGWVFPSARREEILSLVRGKPVESTEPKKAVEPKKDEPKKATPKKVVAGHKAQKAARRPSKVVKVNVAAAAA